MNWIILFAALLFAGIAIWGGASMIESLRKTAPHPRVRGAGQTRIESER